MTCPNAEPQHADIDCVAGMIPWRSGKHRVPCGWCWVAAGHDILQIRQADALLDWRNALDELVEPAQLTLDGDEQRGREFDRICERVRALGITDDVRSAWLLWCQRAQEVTA